jgi:hypothetical protein
MASERLLCSFDQAAACLGCCCLFECHIYLFNTVWTVGFLII